MKAAIFLAPSFLKDLLKPKWQKEIRSITREALLALEEAKMPSFFCRNCFMKKENSMSLFCLICAKEKAKHFFPY